MGNLQAAHLGYEYQDLLSALAVLDLLWEPGLEAVVDKKVLDEDRFDDLTLHKNGFRHRTQFKHSDSPSPLTLATFTQDARSLKLNKLVQCAKGDRERYGDGVDDYVFRIVMRDLVPDDETLSQVLKSDQSLSPFDKRLGTRRFRFDVEALWPESAESSGPKPFSFLLKGAESVEREDLAWFCSHAILELEAPRFSSSLTDPGEAEIALLSRIKDEVGVGLYPNEHRLPEDAAAAFLGLVRASRQGRATVSKKELLRAAQLRQDYGAVAREFPVDQSIAVPREAAVERLTNKLVQTSTTGGTVIVTGPPGHGKSYLSQQVIEALSKSGWVVGEHYCFLNQGTTEAAIRVDANVMLGSLFARLVEAEPDLGKSQRPYLAADKNTLESALDELTTGADGRKVALVVDGLDHASRVLGQTRLLDPSRELASVLASIRLPAGAVLVVLSQVGDFLEPLELDGGHVYETPGLTKQEILEVANKLGVGAGWPDKDLVLDTLFELSGGNGLYARYLCKELQIGSFEAGSEVAALRSLPAFDGTLEAYYTHLYDNLDAVGGGVADLLAVLSFALTREEFCQIDPALTHRVDKALATLKPVLIEVASQGGVRVYHESFGRYLLARFRDHVEVLQALHGKVADWLLNKGIFQDHRAFSFLIPALISAMRAVDVANLIGPEFVGRAMAAGHSPVSIGKNLQLGMECAGGQNDWPGVIRCVELLRSLYSFEVERLDTLLCDFADVALACVGADALVERLLRANQPQMSARSGLLLCGAIDMAGGNPPWREYMLAYQRESESDTTGYGAQSEREVKQAWLLGRLRLGSLAERGKDLPAESLNLESPVSLELLGRHLEAFDFDEDFVARALIATLPIEEIETLVTGLNEPGVYALAVAEALVDAGTPDAAVDISVWLRVAVEATQESGNFARLMRLGVGIEQVRGNFEKHTIELAALTHKIAALEYRLDTNEVARWMDLCDFSAAAGFGELSAIVDLAVRANSGWYHSFLRYYAHLAVADFGTPNQRSTRALEALTMLTEETDPFRGRPRACDLYQIHGLIRKAILRCSKMLSDEDWVAGLSALQVASQNTSTSIFGELNGPIRPDFVLEIVCLRPNWVFREIAQILEKLSDGGVAESPYSDIASFYLFQARFHIRAGNGNEGMAMWRRACDLLAAYGSRRDTTIFELLGPLDAMAEIDRPRTVEALAKLQPLCVRVLVHTDGKDTRHCLETWWKALMRIAPVSGSELIAKGLLAEFNMPHFMFEEARNELWRATSSTSDVTLSALLRLSLSLSVDDCDVAFQQRLREEQNPDGKELVPLLIARLEERTTDYTYTNADEVMAQDWHLVGKIVDSAGPTAPTLLPFAKGFESVSRENPPWNRQPSKNSSAVKEAIDAQLVLDAPHGVEGIRVITKLIDGMDSTEFNREEPRLLSMLGYRVMEVLQASEDDAIAMLYGIANSLRFKDSTLLGDIAEGLTKQGHAEAAATAATLMWTRSRGGNGWMIFGGEKEMSWLKQAFELSHDRARGVLIGEISEVFNAGLGTFGLTQALIIALARVPALEKSEQDIHVAIRAWQAAADVIEMRTPRLSEADDPEMPFSERMRTDDYPDASEVNSSIVLAMIAGLSSPSREQKRRTLLAIRIGLNLHPEIVAAVLSDTLLAIKDPATLVWLLSILDVMKDETALALCKSALRTLSKSEFLTVRALAGSLVQIPVDLPDALPEHPRLAGGETLWLPDEGDGPDSRSTMMLEVVAHQAGARLQEAEWLLPGLGDAVVDTLEAPDLRSKIVARASRQATILNYRQSSEVPDAWMAMEEETEKQLQLIAATARGTYISRGLPFDPSSLERALGFALRDDPSTALLVERTRHPRIVTTEIPNPGASEWRGLERRQDKLGGTISRVPGAETPRVQSGVYAGWHICARADRLKIRKPKSSNRSDPWMTALMFSAIELGPAPIEKPPFGEGSLAVMLQPTRLEQWLKSPAPLMSLDRDNDIWKDGKETLGVTSPIVLPTVAVVSLLGLEPGVDKLVLNDQEGPGMALLTWRGRYVETERSIGLPTLTGSAVVVRPDLFGKTLGRFGPGMIFREYLTGDEEWLAGRS